MLSEEYTKGSHILQLQDQTWQSIKTLVIYENYYENRFLASF
jgi:hypothetical protein